MIENIEQLIIKSNNFGHVDSKQIIPIGVIAKIDTDDDIRFIRRLKRDIEKITAERQFGCNSKLTFPSAVCIILISIYQEVSLWNTDFGPSFPLC